MGKEELYGAAKGTYSLVGGFLKDVAQEIGMERATALYANQGKTFGTMLTGMINEKLGDNELDTATIASVMAEATDGLGFTAKIETSPTSVQIKTSRCPIYDGFREAGLDHETIGSICSRVSALEQAELKKSYPQLSGCMKFRAAADRPCVEEFSIET